MSDSPSAGAMQYRSMARQQISPPALAFRFAAQKPPRVLTERFFLYRFVVFCPEKTNASTASENLEQ
jgi:hypothetical protein